MKIKQILYIASLFVIVSCGGGGGGGSSDNANDYVTPNRAPNITNSSTNISVQENQTAVVTVTASDPDGDSLTYSLNATSGNDSALFDITSTGGVITFKTAPDFEIPTDADADNVYALVAIVSDGSLNLSLIHI